MSNTSVGFGVIGYGYWGPNLVRNFATDEVLPRHRRRRPERGQPGEGRPLPSQIRDHAGRSRASAEPPLVETITGRAPRLR